MSEGDDEAERAYLAKLARWLGAEDLSEERLARSLGFDELTDEKLEALFERVRRGGGSGPGVDEKVTVTEVDEDRARLSGRKGKRRKPS